MSTLEILTADGTGERSPRPERPSRPLWERRDAGVSTALVLIGALVWAAGWHRVSGRSAFEDQLAPMNLAIAGVVLIGAGQVMWFRAGRRAVAERRRLVLGTAPQGPQDQPAADSSTDDLVTGGERFFHRLSCPLVEGRPWPVSERNDQVAAGRVPCGVCEP